MKSQPRSRALNFVDKAFIVLFLFTLVASFSSTVFASIDKPSERSSGRYPIFCDAPYTGSNEKYQCRTKH